MLWAEDTVPTYRLEGVEVTHRMTEVNSDAYRLVTSISEEEFRDLPVVTISDVLNYMPGIDVRTRCANGAQADVSMRGGTFDQVLIMVNGVSMSDAQTGHYSMNLPVDPALIERIEILQGASPEIFGVNAFSGAINIITKRTGDYADDYRLRLTGGMYGLVSPSLAVRWQRNDCHYAISGSYQRSDGYNAPGASEKETTAMRNSDNRIAHIFFQSSFYGVDVQAGAEYKDAGAGMFYGFGSQDQYDATRTAFAAAQYKHQWGGWGLQAQLSYRANYDRYEWHRGQRLYGNFHFTQNAAASVKGSYSYSIGRTTIGLEVRNENIRSTNLGDTVNPNGQRPNVEGFELSDLRVLDLVLGDNRLNVNYFVNQAFFYKNFSASLGVNGNYNSRFGNNVAGGLNLGYAYLPGSSVYVNANRSLRMPTFTDLYYNAGNQLGSRDLRPEKAWTIDLGANYNKSFGRAGSLKTEVNAYYRFGRDIIDWVFVPDDAKRPFHAQNVEKVDAAGVELSAAYTWNRWLRRVQLSYAYTYMDMGEHLEMSRYLDYLSHKVVLRVDHGIAGFKNSEIAASWVLTYQRREGNYNNVDGQVCSYRPVLLLDGQLYWQNRNFKVAVDVTNITNRHYYDYGGILQPGAWAKVTFSAKL